MTLWKDRSFLYGYYSESCSELYFGYHDDSSIYYDMWRDGLENVIIAIPYDNTITIQFSFTEHQYDNWGWDNFSSQICHLSLKWINEEGRL